jgi:hypothetical protein
MISSKQTTIILDDDVEGISALSDESHEEQQL